MLQMRPRKVRDFIFQTVGSRVRSEETVERVRTLLASRAAMTPGSGATLMDVAELLGVGKEGEWDEDVGAVSMGVQCHGCQGWGANFAAIAPPQPPRKACMKGSGKARES